MTSCSNIQIGSTNKYQCLSNALLAQKYSDDCDALGKLTNQLDQGKITSVDPYLVIAGSTVVNDMANQYLDSEFEVCDQAWLEIDEYGLFDSFGQLIGFQKRAASGGTYYFNPIGEQVYVDLGLPRKTSIDFDYLSKATTSQKLFDDKMFLLANEASPYRSLLGRNKTIQLADYEGNLLVQGFQNPLQKTKYELFYSNDIYVGRIEFGEKIELFDPSGEEIYWAHSNTMPVHSSLDYQGMQELVDAMRKGSYVVDEYPVTRNAIIRPTGGSALAFIYYENGNNGEVFSNTGKYIGDIKESCFIDILGGEVFCGDLLNVDESVLTRAGKMVESSKNIWDRCVYWLKRIRRGIRAGAK
ncbi:MAG: hypothetical protein WC890_00765 [Candidatus Margulisiibacteriota bacterium]